MKLIVGLGNFPSEYQNTRHNAGFICVDYFCQQNNLTLNQTKFNGVFYKGDNFIIAEPHTYINLSGEFVKAIMDYFKIPVEDLLVIYDDIDTDVGKFRLRVSGTPGGHNGIKNIINLLGTNNIKRIRVGINHPPKEVLLADYVLGKFSSAERKELENVANKVSEIIQEFCADVNFEKLMSKYNK
ncbi:MAG: aminoacyl-tRNA hydrolase [Mycoplasmataceae bacterium]|jgi:PTH1 family peptidyl-tRNA hydrolase|nr:aminoacyl-tRNA hydrolase [Mycoplasmataceae bacterium]